MEFLFIRKYDCSKFYIISSFGKVGITKHPDADRVFTQAEPITIERGGCFGEVALANKCTRTASGQFSNLPLYRSYLAPSSGQMFENQ